jgi:hypothetical protein
VYLAEAFSFATSGNVYQFAALLNSGEHTRLACRRSRPRDSGLCLSARVAESLWFRRGRQNMHARRVRSPEKLTITLLLRRHCAA